MTKAGQPSARVSSSLVDAAVEPDVRSPVSPDPSVSVQTVRKPQLSDQIGNKLKSVYNEVLSQPVPDRFLDLLKELDGVKGMK